MREAAAPRRALPARRPGAVGARLRRAAGVLHPATPSTCSGSARPRRGSGWCSSAPLAPVTMALSGGRAREPAAPPAPRGRRRGPARYRPPGGPAAASSVLTAARVWPPRRSASASSRRSAFPRSPRNSCRPDETWGAGATPRCTSRSVFGGRGGRVTRGGLDRRGDRLPSLDHGGRRPRDPRRAGAAGPAAARAGLGPRRRGLRPGWPGWMSALAALAASCARRRDCSSSKMRLPRLKRGPPASINGLGHGPEALRRSGLPHTT